VCGDTDELRRLAGSVRAGARRSGVRIEDRPYRPHLTLARAQGQVDLRAPVAAMAEFASSPWQATQLHLVRSHLGAGPDHTARHEPLMCWPLGRAGAELTSPSAG
jgi:2'-5' RNA ligase